MKRTIGSSVGVKRGPKGLETTLFLSLSLLTRLSMIRRIKAERIEEYMRSKLLGGLGMQVEGLA